MLIVCTTQGCISDDDPQGTALQPGDSLPSFSATLTDGTVVSNTSLAGKVGVIVFFNTDCSDCRQELPVIQQLYDRVSQNPDVVVAPIARAESQDKIQQYWNDNGLSMPFSPQDNKDVYLLFAPSVIPRIFISNRQGVITFSSGDTDMPDLDTLLAEIEKNL